MRFNSTVKSPQVDIDRILQTAYVAPNGRLRFSKYAETLVIKTREYMHKTFYQDPRVIEMNKVLQQKWLASEKHMCHVKKCLKSKIFNEINQLE